jgi:serine/threonine protein kinase
MNEPPNRPEHAGADQGRTLIPENTPPARALSAEFGSHHAISALPYTFGHYELLAEIARGGMGIIYKARQRELDRLVALKMILADPDSITLERFTLEARAAAGLDHPNIVPVYESGWVEGRPYFTMALVKGENLQEHVEAHGLPDPRKAVELLRGIVDAVAHAHARGVVHRDLKPQNVLIDESGRPRVTDFGLARRFREPTNLTSPGQLLGTPQYMAPEQALGDARAIGPPVDIYALGGILYFLLTGNPPFTGPLTMTVLRQVVEEPPVPPHEINANVPRGLQNICLVCLEKRPDRRYPSAKALGAALAEWARQSDTLVGPSPEYSPPAPPAAPTTARRLLVGLLGLGALLAAFVGAGAYLKRAKEVEQADQVGPPSAEGPSPLTGPGPDLPEERQDFALKVELAGSRGGPQGRRVFTEGDRVTFRITAELDAYVGIWSVEADGTITQLFPNRFEPNNKVRAGEERVVPGSDLYIIPTEATAPNRADAIWVVASTSRWDALKGEQDGPFILFRKGAEGNKAMTALRKMVIRPTTEVVQTSAKSLLYVVLPSKLEGRP